MRSVLRKSALVLSLISLLFFLSCERHHVGELAGETDAPAHEQTKHDQPNAMTSHSHTSQSPAPRNSPANFFPDKPKP